MVVGYDLYVSPKQEIFLEKWQFENLPAPDPEMLLEQRGPSESYGTQEELSCLIARLPAEDYDVCTMYFRDHMTQLAIGKVLGIGQCTVSCRIKKSKKRLAFLRTYPLILKEQFETELSRFGSRDKEILWDLYHHTNQSYVFRKHGFPNNMRLRYHLGRLLNDIRIARDFGCTHLEKYLVAFELLQDRHWGILWHQDTGKPKKR